MRAGEAAAVAAVLLWAPEDGESGQANNQKAHWAFAYLGLFPSDDSSAATYAKRGRGEAVAPSAWRLDWRTNGRRIVARFLGEGAAGEGGGEEERAEVGGRKEEERDGRHGWSTQGPPSCPLLASRRARFARPSRGFAAQVPHRRPTKPYGESLFPCINLGYSIAFVWFSLSSLRELVIFCARRLEAKPQICSPFSRERFFLGKKLSFSYLFMEANHGLKWKLWHSCAELRYRVLDSCCSFFMLKCSHSFNNQSRLTSPEYIAPQS